MEKQIITILLILIIKISIFAQEPDNTKPMYGNVEKSEKYKEIDNRFIETVVKQNGTKDSACKVYVDFAWRHLSDNDTEVAMKRFNQVWLLNPNNCDAYYGFYATIKFKGNDEEAEKYFSI